MEDFFKHLIQAYFKTAIHRFLFVSLQNDWVYCNITVICGAPYLDSPLPQFLQKKKKLSFDFKDIMCFSVAVQQITTKLWLKITNLVHSFCGSGVQAQLSQVPCSGSHQTAVRLSARARALSEAKVHFMRPWQKPFPYSWRTHGILCLRGLLENLISETTVSPPSKGPPD